MSDKKIDLIAKLLAKAESTTPEEAEALTAHAERLMVKYMIDQATIDARRAREGKSHEQIVTAVIVFEGMYRDSLMEMGSKIVWALGSMRPLRSKMRLQTHLHIVGFESDVRQAETLIRSLHVQCLLALTPWWNSARYREYKHSPQGEKVRARHQFVRSFGSGAAERITTARSQAIEDSGNGTDLVLVDRKSKVDEFVDGLGVRRSRVRRRSYDWTAAQAGLAAGMNANTGERSMTQGRGLPAGAQR